MHLRYNVRSDLLLYSFKYCGYKDIEQFVTKYVDSFSSPIDSFLEDHILDSNYYLIEYDSAYIGCFAVYEKQTITLFYLDREYRHLSQDIFARVKKMEEVLSAMIATCDEFFLSCALDSYKSIDKQAYFFQDAKNQDVTTNIELRVAIMDDMDSIKSNSADFFDDDLEDCIKKREVYIATNDSEVVGYGIVSKGRVMKGYSSIGMYTVERFRKQGFATKIILNLKELVYSMDMIPIAGCWYYNHNSKKTLEKAGMYTNTRLIKIHF